MTTPVSNSHLSSSTITSAGSTASSGGEMGKTLGFMSANVDEQMAFLAGETELQNKLNYAMSLDQLMKQAGTNAKTLTQG